MTERRNSGNPERPWGDFGMLNLEYGSDGRIPRQGVKGVNDLHLDEGVMGVIVTPFTPEICYTYYTFGSEGDPAGEVLQPAAEIGQSPVDSSGKEQSKEEKKQKQSYITRDDVRRVYIEQLAHNKGDLPTSTQIRAALHNHGSLKTICKYKKELDKEYGVTAKRPNVTAIQEQTIKELTAVLSASVAEYKIGLYEEQLAKKQEEIDFLNRRYLDETKSMATSYDEINLQNKEHTAAVEELRKKEKEHIETISRLQTKVCQLENKLAAYRSIEQFIALLKIDPKQIAGLLKAESQARAGLIMILRRVLVRFGVQTL